MDSHLFGHFYGVDASKRLDLISSKHVISLPGCAYDGQACLWRFLNLLHLEPGVGSTEQQRPIIRIPLFRVLNTLHCEIKRATAIGQLENGGKSRPLTGPIALCRETGYRAVADTVQTPTPELLF